jgi:hypothetical protein
VIGAAAVTDSDVERRPRKKKKRKRKEAAASAEAGRPAFAKGYPRTAALDRLVAAFAAGDFGLVRREAPEVEASANDAAVRRAVQDLRRRIAPDPTAIYLWAIGVVLLVVIYGWYLMHPR